MNPYLLMLPIPGSHDAASHDTAAEEQLKELYNCSFLVDDPSSTQLEGVCNKHKKLNSLVPRGI